MQSKFTRRTASIALGLGALALAGAALAQAPAFFRIGTGGTAGTYYPIGGLIANAISAPPQLVSTAVASNGSVANVNAIVGGAAESGFVQADVAYWAYSGTGVFEGKPKIADLRSIANLYPESVHLVVRKAANVKSVADLKGKKVSLDEPGSGTLLNAKAILAAFGVTEKDISAEYLKPNQAAEKMKDGSVDAYKDVGAVKTIAVGAHWVTSAKISNDTVYAVTKALWSDKARAALDAGHAKGKVIRKETALSGLQGVPLHPGAEKFYKEAGLLK
jgi:TRAP transporter TAXI family solute receptor